MEKENIKIGSAVYTGVCIYNSLRNMIVKIENDFVSLDDKVDLSLYLGVIHSKNEISESLRDTEIKRETLVNYKRLTSKEFCKIYDMYFKNIIDNINKETMKNYFDELLKKDIVIKLNREYGIDMINTINTCNKQLIKR